MTAGEVQAHLRTRWLGRDLRVVAETGSTNDDLLGLARAGAAGGTVLIAEAQGRGRGRLGRAWASPPGLNLYLSALLRPDVPAGALPPVTLTAAVAVADAVHDLGVSVSIKWPNDVLARDKKVAGILTESVVRGARLDALVIGVGVNLNGLALPPELAAIATSVAQVLGRPVDRPAFAAALLGRLEHWLDRLFSGGGEEIIVAWKARSATLGRRVLVKDGVTDGDQPVSGWARDVDPDGALVVVRDDGSAVRVRSGEVHLEASP